MTVWRMTVWRSSILVLALALAGCSGTRSRPHVPERRATLFVFANSFWFNLHQRLLVSAQAATAARAVPAATGSATWIDPGIWRDSNSDEIEAWNAAVAVYRAAIPRVFCKTNDLLSGALDKASEATAVAAQTVPREVLATQRLAAALARVAPLYRKRQWAADQARNRAWRGELQRLRPDAWATMAARIARAFGTTWPAAPMRVQVVAVAPEPGAAYTTIVPPLTTIASAKSSTAGSLAGETTSSRSFGRGCPTSTDT